MFNRRGVGVGGNKVEGLNEKLQAYKREWHLLYVRQTTVLQITNPPTTTSRVEFRLLNGHTIGRSSTSRRAYSECSEQSRTV